jgi:hypothetical protein
LKRNLQNAVFNLFECSNGGQKACPMCILMMTIPRVIASHFQAGGITMTTEVAKIHA